MSKKTLLIGAHMSIAGGFTYAIDRALQAECTTMQIFTKNNKSWDAKPIDEADALTFKKKLKQSKLKKIMAHASYLINLGSSNSEVRHKSIQSLSLELRRCEQLDIPYLILHPGAHTGAGEDKGIERITEGLDTVLETFTGKTMVLLETAAGQGTNIGYNIQQLHNIISRSTMKKFLGICVDTCHIFAAGHNIGADDGYDFFFNELINTLGLEKLKAIHLNDSKTILGSKKDRHEKIGKGNIPIKTFKKILLDERFKDIPKVLETPIIKNAVQEYQEEISLLKKLIA